MKITLAALASVSLALPEPFLDQNDAHIFLKRVKRAWQFFEERKDGNWERECIEEDCDANEAFEVVDEEVRGKRLYQLVGDCKAEFPTIDNVRNCVENGLDATWGQWSEWSECSATCEISRSSTPFRQMSRTCMPGVNSRVCPVDGNRMRSEISISGDDDQTVDIKAENCEHLPSCNNLETALNLRTNNGNTLFARTSWFPIESLDGYMTIFWRIDDVIFASFTGETERFVFFRDDPRSIRRRSKLEVDQEGRWAELTIKDVNESDRGMKISTEMVYGRFRSEDEVTFE